MFLFDKRAKSGSEFKFQIDPVSRSFYRKLNGGLFPPNRLIGIHYINMYPLHLKIKELKTDPVSGQKIGNLYLGTKLIHQFIKAKQKIKLIYNL